jgi:spermidine/putrescine transport system substrate-binding protein
MKRVISALAAVFVFAALFFGIMIPAGLPAHAQTDELYIYNWADYIDPETINDFEQYYYEQTGKNLNVVYSTFDTNEVMLTQVMNNDERMDLLCPSEYAIERLVRNNMLMELDKTKLHNISNIDQRIYDKVDAVFDDIVINNTQIALSDYFVPYMWGTLGILYNAQIVREEDIEAGYGILWKTKACSSLSIPSTTQCLKRWKTLWWNKNLSLRVMRWITARMKSWPIKPMLGFLGAETLYWPWRKTKT